MCITVYRVSRGKIESFTLIKETDKSFIVECAGKYTLPKFKVSNYDGFLPKNVRTQIATLDRQVAIEHKDKQKQALIAYHENELAKAHKL